MAILILTSFILVTVLLMIWRGGDLRIHLIKGFLLVLFTILISTEFLNTLNRIDYQSVAGTWILINSLLFCFLILIGKKNSVTWHTLKSKLNQLRFTPNLITLLGFGITLVISVITLFIALKSPPNNFDSMTYHMARIPNWIQNKSINYYPTSIPRQNYSQPLAEFAILHLQLLSKGDQFANLIQWFSFMLAITGTTLIAKELKLSTTAQWITGAIAATLPMAILQSTSTQNDLLVSALCISFFYLLITAARQLRWENYLFSGIAMGLALATKGTSYVYCAAIGLGIGLVSLLGRDLTNSKPKKVLRFALVLLIGLGLSSGIYFRNWKLYRNPIITSNQRTIVEKVTPSIVGANLLRNSLIHLASPFDAVNNRIGSWTERILGTEINNPESTFQDTQFKLSFSLNEDEAGNGIHLILISLALGILAWKRNNNREILSKYLLVIAFGFLFFSLVFKWQPWGGRLQTPFFLLGSIAVAYVFDRSPHQKIISATTLFVLLLTSLPYLLLNSNRPVIPIWEDVSVFYDSKLEKRFYTYLGDRLDRFPTLKQNLSSIASIFYDGMSINLTERRELYFLSNKDIYWPYVGAYSKIRNHPATEIGLIMDSNDWEYPLWVLLKEHASNHKREIYHLAVNDISRTLESQRNPLPELIFVTRDEIADLKILNEYNLIYDSEFIQTYEKR